MNLKTDIIFTSSYLKISKINTIILPVKTSEAEALKRLSSQTFYETFESHNSTENVQHYIQTAYSVEQLTQELNSSHSKFFFAKAEDQLVGYIKMNEAEAQTELQDPNAMELERIYVLKSHHGKNIGQQLMDYAIEHASSAGYQYVWLGVWEKNERAIRFYKKNGFEIFGSHEFRMGHEVQTDFLMKLHPLRHSNT